MADAPERLSRTIWIGVGLVIILIGLTFTSSRLEPRSGRTSPLPVLGKVADFSLTNQVGQTVTLKDLRGKVWLGDIIFTRCPGPCARMTRQMRSIQDAPAFKNSQAKLISLTTDPDFDSPSVLREYSVRFGANPQRWMFLTGTKKELANLAIDSLKLTVVEKKPADRDEANDLFIHSTIFVLVDKQARLRGVYETGGEGVEWTNVQPAIVSAIHQLEHEP